jgi:hypothetical protein
MFRHGYTYEGLAAAMGGKLSTQSLVTKVNRGTFTAAFLLEAICAMGTKSLNISHLPLGVRAKKKPSSSR